MKGNRHDRGNHPGARMRVVDLHLRPGYSGRDAIDRQLARFRGELDSAIRAGIREIIFVHGRGSGKLRDEIRNIIAREYPGCTAGDASFAMYGYGGATTIMVKQ